MNTSQMACMLVRNGQSKSQMESDQKQGMYPEVWYLKIKL